jgi:hypothetical protein
MHGTPVDNPEVRAFLRTQGNIVTSVLGSSLEYLQINSMSNSLSVSDVNCAFPFMLKANDIIAMNSDGLEPVCAEHEYPLLVYEANGDLGKARDSAITLAESRPANVLYHVRCAEFGYECEPREGKNDDKSLILRYALEGMDRRNL